MNLNNTNNPYPYGIAAILVLLFTALTLSRILIQPDPNAIADFIFEALQITLIVIALHSLLEYLGERKNKDTTKK